MKRLITYLFICSVLPAVWLHAQNNDFIYLKDNKFIQGCNEFYPIVINYSVEILGNTISGYFIAPKHNYFNNNNNCINEADGLNKLRAHLAMIKNMGFNTIRVCGLGVSTDSNATTGNLYAGINDASSELVSPYTPHLAMIGKFLDVAEEFNLIVI